VRSIRPRVRLSFSGRTLANSLPHPPTPPPSAEDVEFYAQTGMRPWVPNPLAPDYRVDNPALAECTITLTLQPGRVITLHRPDGDRSSTRQGYPRYDHSPSIDTCVFDAVGIADIDRALDAVELNQLTGVATLSVRYNQLSYFMLKEMAKTGEGTRSLANPDDATRQRIMDSFRHERDHGHAVYVQNTHGLHTVPCTLGLLSSSDLYDEVAVLNIALHLEGLSDVDRDEFVLSVMAAHHTTICELEAAHRVSNPNADEHRFDGVPGLLTLRDRLFDNLVRYVWNHTDLERAGRIFDEVVEAAHVDVWHARAQAGARSDNNLVLEEAARSIRNEIDSRLVTANDYAEGREDGPGPLEAYQRRLSDLLGALQALRGVASPVALLRALKDRASSFWTNAATRASLANVRPLRDGPDGPLSESEVAANLKALLALQHGVGHCGEHADVSYAIIAELLRRTPDTRAVLVGVVQVTYVNTRDLDHAFVVGGFQPQIINQLAQEQGELDRQFVFDVEGSLPSGVNGFLLDPYLERTRDGSCTARGLIPLLRQRYGRGSWPRLVGYRFYPRGPHAVQV
jgi:hypothetical protein